MTVRDPLQTADEWLSGPVDPETKQEILELKKTNPAMLRDAFSSTLHFGTGGMRGLMGVGTSKLNPYTIQMATQGLANHLHKHFKTPSVFISFDCRNHSKEFAQFTARVLAGNQITAYLCQELRPTPFVSFGVRAKGCSAGVMITASHNPKEYNGYKVFWADGGQVVLPHDEAIAEEVAKIKGLSEVNIAPPNSPFIQLVGPELDLIYLTEIGKLQLSPKEAKEVGDRLSITYTPLHGTGAAFIAKGLKLWGFSHINLVDSQLLPDGNFPTVKSPNPETIEALALGLAQMEATQSDLLIATDPDADRMGVAALHKKRPFVFTGNQIASIFLEFLCSRPFPKNSGVVSTIVSTDLLKEIAKKHAVSYFDVLTGFKYIGEKIHQWELGQDPHHFLFGAEESLGYLFGTYARDKDATIASCLVATIALLMKIEGRTLVDYLSEIYKKYGFFAEGQKTIDFPPGKTGMDQMNGMMGKLRTSPPKEIAGKRVEAIEDYQKRVRVDLLTKKTEPLTLPISDVLLYRLEGKGKVVVRPSGTEPKLKIYGAVFAPEFSEMGKMTEWGKKKLGELFDATSSLL